ncbi:MAG TPA: histidine phosphatase family protein [Vicinamibacterales bacterium]|nr:histidine phosphatase family protein [Vicinamibacterales bacterium]
MHSSDTLLYLVRHGETDWNRERRLQGTLDVPLNDTGIAQARQLASHFTALPIAGVASSPLVRSSATAVLLANVRVCPLRIDARLREVDHGSLSGVTMADIAQRFPSLVENDQLTSEAFDVSGGECLLDVSRRVSDVLADLLSWHEGQSVVVVGHGVTLAVMWCAAHAVDPARFGAHVPPNAAGVVLRFSQRQLIESRPVVSAPVEMPQ